MNKNPSDVLGFFIDKITTFKKTFKLTFIIGESNGK